MDNDEQYESEEFESPVEERELGHVPAGIARSLGGNSPTGFAGGSEAGHAGGVPAQRESTAFASREQDGGEPRDSMSRFISGETSGQEDLEEDEDALLPRQPRTVLDLGLSKAFLTDLVLKIVHYSGTPSMVQLTRRLGLGPSIVQNLIAALTEEHLLEVLSQSDLYTGNYRYRLSARGQQKVNEALERSRYAGPAPVTAEQYGEVIRKIQAHPQDLGRGKIKQILNEL